MASRPILDGAVQVYQVQGGTRKLVGVGFGEPSTDTDRWFIHTGTAPTMTPTNATRTTFEPLAGQDLNNRWTLSTWTTKSNPASSHDSGDDSTIAHNPAPYLRHRLSNFKYIKSAVDSMAGIPTESTLISRIPVPFDEDGEQPSGRSAQIDPGYYRAFPIDQYGVVIPNSSTIAHVFVPSVDPDGAPEGITQDPYSLDIWFIKDRATFPAPPDDYGYMLEPDPTSGAPESDTPLADVLDWVRNLSGYGSASATSIIVSTAYYNTRPTTP